MANIHARTMSAYLWVVLAESRSSVTRQASGSAIRRRLSVPANNKTPPSDDNRPPSNRAHSPVPATGDNPSR
jgi:hypothetical protein